MNRRIAVALGAAAALAPAPALAACTVTHLLELKVTMEGRGPMVPVTINGHEERMLVDSGAFFSSISAGKGAELGLHGAPTSLRVSGIGGEMAATLATVRDVGLAGLQLHNIPFIVGGSEIGRAAGLLGQNVLGIGDVEYDLAHGAIRLMRPHDCKGTTLAYWPSSSAISTVAIEPRDEHNPHTIGTVLVDGVKIRAVFDTGADQTVMTLAAAAKLGIKPDSPGVRADGYSHGVGRRTVADYVIPVDSIKLGDAEEIRRTHLRASASLGEDTEMLIGADFFLSHRVYVSNALHRLFFTYNGGPVFGTRAGPVVDQAGAAVTVAPVAEAEPTDAAGYSRRGAAFLSRRDFPHAFADMDRAVALAPTEPRYLFQRAQARQAARQPLLAMDDLDRTLKLDPANAEARLMRAAIRLGRHDRAAAEEDVATVDREAPPAADARLTLAGMDEALDQPAQAIAQYDLWLKYHGDDSRKPTALNGRCWARAVAGVDLGKALSDCDAAIRARPNAAAYLDSRALVRLKMGDAERAAADYDAALALQPRYANALYGRGVARQRLGRKDDGKKDIDAATALDAGVAERAKRIGLVP